MTTTAPHLSAARRDRVLRAIAIAVLAPLTAWVIMRWFAEAVDFHIYRYASLRALHGSDIYAGDIAGPGIGGHGLPYTYPPFALLALLPTTLGRWSTAYHVWGLAAALAVAWTVTFLIYAIRAARDRDPGTEAELAAVARAPSHSSLLTGGEQGKSSWPALSTRCRRSGLTTSAGAAQ